MKQDETTHLDLQGAVEQFLDDTRARRPESVTKRYSTALDLLLTYLALELIDPESQDDDPGRAASQVLSLTPELLSRYVTEFLTERVGRSPKALSRHVTALKAFLRFLASRSSMPPAQASELAEALDNAVESLSPPSGDSQAVPFPRLLRLLSADEEPALLQDMASGKQVRASLANPHDLELEEGRVYLVSFSRGIRGPVANLLGLLDSPLAQLAQNLGVETDQDDGEEGEDFEPYLDDEEDDWWADDLDIDLADNPLDPDYFSLTPAEALEILSIEDRFAPRKVVETIINNYEEVRPDLLEWIHDEHLRSVPLPGMGEAPANAARILSEMGEMDIAPRLISILGQLDPLGEEAPPALARLGPEVLSSLQKVLKEKRQTSDRRIATLWAMGYMAARHPAVRGKILGILLDEVLKGKPEAQTALTILGELRATEVLPKVRRAENSGKLNLEMLGHTFDLFEDQVSSPNWGEIVGEILVPVVFLYPTDEQLDALYESSGTDFDDLEEDWPDEDWDEEGWDGPDDLPPSRPRKKRPSPSSRPPTKGNVIPFRPKDPDKDEE